MMNTPSANAPGGGVVKPAGPSAHPTTAAYALSAGSVYDQPYAVARYFVVLSWRPVTERPSTVTFIEPGTIESVVCLANDASCAAVNVVGGVPAHPATLSQNVSTTGKNKATPDGTEHLRYVGTGGPRKTPDKNQTWPLWPSVQSTGVGFDGVPGFALVTGLEAMSGLSNAHCHSRADHCPYDSPNG